jgi:hypothetical protein
MEISVRKVGQKLMARTKTLSKIKLFCSKHEAGSFGWGNYFNVIDGNYGAYSP